MDIFSWLLVGFWCVFLLYWIISSFFVKRNVGGKQAWARGFGGRIIMVIVLFLAFAYEGNSTFLVTSSPALRWVGVALCAAGIAFAIWARAYLGRNWSGTPQMKVDHELVTSGPYRWVRHPIYTGIIAAVLGSTITTGGVWYLVVIFYCVLFAWRIPIEEGYMMKLFPDQYPAYKARTKALIPFVL